MQLIPEASSVCYLQKILESEFIISLNKEKFTSVLNLIVSNFRLQSTPHKRKDFTDIDEIFQYDNDHHYHRGGSPSFWILQCFEQFLPDSSRNLSSNNNSSTDLNRNSRQRISKAQRKIQKKSLNKSLSNHSNINNFNQNVVLQNSEDEYSNISENIDSSSIQYSVNITHGILIRISSDKSEEFEVLNSEDYCESLLSSVKFYEQRNISGSGSGL